MVPVGRHRGGGDPRVVVMPEVTHGLCRIRDCWVVGDLAVGLCVEHWDRGLDRAENIHKLPAGVK